MANGYHSTRLKIEARSESIVKWAKRLEEEFELEQTGGNPTQRIEGAIEQIKEKLQLSPEDANALNSFIASAYNIGAQVGFQRALKHVQEGRITVRKEVNKDFWNLYTYSTEYQITQNLPSMSGEKLKETVYINLSEHGFKY
ncbi:hypothetical protein [Vibrio sp. D431a]|uniref:hypothetical protein n=1 Tax=Vibrio sp. D431a TaxID=2837388 RepID=UPI002554A5E2|nr:hypothetical protein [Vibrio sp. D431a]MDK9789907.1 hypothetical protein [Vibrio sp. D431a]